MMKNLLLILALVAIIPCCTFKKKQNLTSDVIVDTLVAKVIKIEKNILMPRRIFVINSKLVVFDETKDSIFKVFSLPNVEFLYSYGKYGHGPEEFNSIISNSMNCLNNNFYFVDRQTLKTYIIDNDEFHLVSRELLRIEKQPVNNLLMINDSCYILDIRPPDEISHEHQLVNIKNKKTIKKFGKYPKENLGLKTNEQKYEAFIKGPALNHSNGKVAVIYGFLDLLKIYNSSFELLNEVTRDNKPPKYSAEKRSDSYIFRLEPLASDKYIYILYYGKTTNEILDSKSNPTIEVWNWDGKIVALYHLDKPITSIALSEEYNKIYGISLTENEMNCIYEYTLPIIKEDAIKQNQYQLFENTYYSVLIPDNWVNSMSKDEINKITNYNNRSYNTNIFVNPISKNKCGFTYWISIIGGDEVKDLSANEYTQLRDEKFKKDAGYYLNSNEKSNGKEISVTSFSILPKEAIDTSYSTLWTWKVNNEFIEIKYTSCKHDDENIEKIFKSIDSFSFKKSLFFN